jgi:flagellar biosynthesis component FlhA
MAQTDSIRVTLELGKAFRAWSDPASKAVSVLCATLGARIQAFLDEFGLPGPVVVDARISPEDEPLRVIVNGSAFACSEEQMRTLSQYYNSSEFDDGCVPYSLEAYISETVGAGSRTEERAESDSPIHFLAQLILEIVKNHPEKLFEEAQAGLYLKRAKAAFRGTGRPSRNLVESEQLVRILQPVLKVGVSIADAATILGHIRQAVTLGLPDDYTAESLISLLRPDPIILEMNPNYAERVLKAKIEKSTSIFDPHFPEFVNSAFRKMAAAILNELGLRLEALAVLPSDRVKDCGVLIRINHLSRLPRKCLRPDQILVNAAPEDVRQILKSCDVLSFPVLNPVNNSVCCVIDQQHEQTVKEAGLWTWDALGYLVLLLQGEIMRNAWRMLDSEAVESALAQLHDNFPDLVETAIEKQSTSMLTRILKVLLQEEITIKNLRAILGRIVSYDHIVTEVDRYIVFDDRLALDKRLDPTLLDGAELRAQHVREGLKKYISHKFVRGGNTLVVYELDPGFESLALDYLAGKSGMASNEISKIRSDLRNELRGEPPSATPPAILTYSLLRLFVRRLVEDEFPTVPVLAYEELSPDLNVQRIGRLGQMAGVGVAR